MLDRSLIFTLANRLCKLGVPRPDALRRAWRMVKQKRFATRVAGVTFGRRQEALARLAKYSACAVRFRLAREPNGFDPNAVAVYAEVAGKGRYKIGYLPRKVAALLSAVLDREGTAVRVAEGRVTGGRYAGWNRGLNLVLELAGCAGVREAA